MSTDLRAFVEHWHVAAKLAVPRMVPEPWLRQAMAMTEGRPPWNMVVTKDDFTLVANWMRSQQRRANDREQGAVAFNANSFRWSLMFGEYGASNEGVRFAELLTLAEAARKPSVALVQKPCAVQPVDAAKAREEAAKVYRDFQEKMRGGSRP